MSASDTGPISDKELALEERALFALMGVIKFDPIAVSAALREGSLSPLGTECLAKLIEGTHPSGLRLAMKGQGKGWKPVFDGAMAYNRLMAVGNFVHERLGANCTVEEAVIDAAEAFAISEPTVYRDLKLYRLAIKDEP